MIPVVPKPPISRRRKAAAIAVAGIVDVLQVGLFPALGIGYLLDDALDVITALVLIAICGFKWQFVVAFLIEIVPVVTLFPTWTAVAMMLPVEAERQNVRVSPDGTSPTHGMIEVTAVQVPPVQSGVAPATPKSP